MRETRSYASRGMDTSVELRDVNGAPTLVGYAAVWNRYSQNLGGFVEIIEPYAFTEALAEGRNIAGLGNHDPNWLLATTGSNTLALTQDEIGLRYEMTLDPTDPDAQRMISKVATGKLPGSSFSFTLGAGGDAWGQTDKGFPKRTLKSVRSVFDVGPVTSPAYLDTAGADAATALRSLVELSGRTLDDVMAAAGRNELRSFLPGATVAEPDRGPARAALVAKLERRSAPAGKTSWAELSAAVWAALDAASQVWVWIEDIGDDWVVYCPYNEDTCYLASWTIDTAGVVTIGEPQQVVETYVPVTDPASAGTKPDPAADLGTGAGLPTRNDPRQNPDVVARLRHLAQLRQVATAA